MTDQSCREFIEALSSKAPVPGGGGAAALMGAIGTALGDMVGSLTLGKKKYADVQEDVIRLKEAAAQLEQEFLELVQADADVFEPLSRAYGLPKETEEQRRHKAEVMEKALTEAAGVPLRIMECCGRAICLVAEMEKIGSVIAISDAGCAAAGLRGGADRRLPECADQYKIHAEPGARRADGAGGAGNAGTVCSAVR